MNFSGFWKNADQDVQQEFAGRVGFICIQALRRRDEPSALAGQLLNGRDTVDQGAAEAIQLPDQDDIESPPPGIEGSDFVL